MPKGLNYYALRIGGELGQASPTLLKMILFRVGISTAPDPQGSGQVVVLTSVYNELQLALSV